MERAQTALSRIFDVLAECPDVQAQLRAEINDTHARLGEDVLHLVKLRTLTLSSVRRCGCTDRRSSPSGGESIAQSMLELPFVHGMSVIGSQDTGLKELHLTWLWPTL